MNKEDAFIKFKQQQAAAKQRKIEWQFNFDDWMAVWEKSGKWEQRGTGKGQYCMGRYGDAGPYSKDNVKIISKADNNRECKPKGHVFTEEERRKFCVPKRKVACPHCGRLGTPKPMIRHVQNCQKFDAIVTSILIPDK